MPRLWKKEGLDSIHLAACCAFADFESAGVKAAHRRAMMNFCRVRMEPQMQRWKKLLADVFNSFLILGLGVTPGNRFNSFLIGSG